VIVARRLKVLIGTFLEPEYVETITSCDGSIEVMYAPELLPVPRYACDHTGLARRLTAAEQGVWESLLARADVSFDFDWQAPAELPRRSPNLRWVQATSAGIGAFMRRTGLDRAELVATTAAGVHALPLAEFALAGALYFAKGFPALRGWQRERRWEPYTTALLAGRRVTVVGLGGIGREVVKLFTALRTVITAVVRADAEPYANGMSRVDFHHVDDVLPTTDILVLCCPLTPETENLIGPRQLAKLPRHAVVINVARGRVVDESALIEALVAGELGGACLDVFASEPLPADSPLWDMENVIVSPHSASTVSTENAALTELFVDNLRRYLLGAPLRNVYRADRGY
jgi:phosphoglycerate dehydrogenase-like enzyme